MTTGVRYRWTDQQKTEMQRLYADGHSLTDIAEQHGCNSETIRYHLRRAGIELRGPGTTGSVARARISADKHPGWKGGRCRDHGYVRLMRKDHPHADASGYIPEHRSVVEQHLLATNPAHDALENGVLSRRWVVHHKNGVKDDNRLENLVALPRGQHHSWLHYWDENERLRQLLAANGIAA